MLQHVPVSNSGWIKDTSQFNENLIKNYNEESDEGYFLEVDVDYQEKLHKLHNDLPFLHERMKIENVEKLVANLHNQIISPGKVTSWGRPMKEALSTFPYGLLCNSKGCPLPTSLGRWNTKSWGRPKVTSWECPHIILYVTPWDVPLQTFWVRLLQTLWGRPYTF